MTLVARERGTYQTIWSGVPQYGEHAPGEHHVPMFLQMAAARRLVKGPTVLDAGCGTGKGALALTAAGFTVTMADLTDVGLVDEARRLRFVEASLWQDLRGAVGYVSGGKFDFVYCCDVLEHIPEAFTMLAVQRLLEVARYGVFLSISTTQDNFGIWVGEPLHKTVQSFVWWRDMLGEVGRVVEARDLLLSGAYYVEPYV